MHPKISESMNLGSLGIFYSKVHGPGLEVAERPTLPVVR
jgi:hypothetical protein